MIQLLQLILSLSFLVIIHELGHFTFARLFHTRVEKFYLFFNYKFSLLRAKRFGGKWHIRLFTKNLTDEVLTDEQRQALPDDDWRKYPDNTEWGIGWIPFGGYCAIAGMVDETKAASDLPSEPQSWEFRSKNVWQRLCIISGGILVNFIAALILFGQILFWWGTDSIPLRNINTGLYYSQLLLDEGFEQQDRILSINGNEPEDLSDVLQWMIIDGKREVCVLRGEDTVSLTMSADLGNRFLAFQNDYDRQEREKQRNDPTYHKSRFVPIGEFFPFVIDSVMPETAAFHAGLQSGDCITGIAGEPTGCYYQVVQELGKHPCDSVRIDVLRNGIPLQTSAFLNDQGKLGCTIRPMYEYYEVEHRDYGFLESVPAGITYGWEMLVNYIKQFRLIFSKEGAQSLGGFGAIGGMFPKLWDWHAFWFMTAFLSLILAFMNFLPIPALDGGYILFLIFEIITRRQPSDKFLETANKIGWILLLALLVLANGNDLLKLFF